MGIRERKERQREATREGILGAALGIARAEGWGAVTVRRVADAIEYASPIVYQHFASKDALLEELQGRGFEALTQALRRAVDADASPRERTLGAGDAYLRFAYANPELYRLMHGWGGAPLALDETLRKASGAGGVILQALQAWAASEEVVLADPADAVETAWALLHGLVSVEMLGRIGGGQARVERLARRGLEALLDAWAA